MQLDSSNKASAAESSDFSRSLRVVPDFEVDSLFLLAPLAAFTTMAQFNRCSIVGATPKIVYSEKISFDNLNGVYKLRINLDTSSNLLSFYCTKWSVGIWI